MAWITNPPNKPGWYGWRKSYPYEPRILEVGMWPGGGLAVRNPHDDRYDAPAGLGGEWWDAPVVPPWEQKEA